MSEIKLHFGCGNNIKEGYVNIDLNKSYGADVCFDMERFPYPFKSDYADEILCRMTLEHIKTPSKAIDEFHRIIKPGGVVRIVVPHFSHASSLLADIHVCVFNTEYFYRRKYPNRDLWGNDCDKWTFISEGKIWNSVDVNLFFPKGWMKVVSFPFQLMFNSSKLMQGVYEHFFSMLYRACEIHVEFRNKQIEN